MKFLNKEKITDKKNIISKNLQWKVVCIKGDSHIKEIMKNPNDAHADDDSAHGSRTEVANYCPESLHHRHRARLIFSVH